MCIRSSACETDVSVGREDLSNLMNESNKWMDTHHVCSLGAEIVLLDNLRPTSVVYSLNLQQIEDSSR